MSKPKLASPRIRAVSLAVHSAGLSLMHAIYGGETELPVSTLETLPT